MKPKIRFLTVISLYAICILNLYSQEMSVTETIAYIYQNVSTPADNLKIHSSYKYHYSLYAPISFKRATSTITNIDMKLMDNIGASILVNVSSRLPEEYKITGHSYSEDYFRSLYKQLGYNITIHNTSKTTVAGQKAFKIIMDHSFDSQLKVLEYSFFKGGQAYVLTCTSPKNSFNSYEEKFRQIAVSMKFQ